VFEIRLDKFLSHSGFGTRKEVKKFLKKGLVKVNKEVVKNPSLKINIEKDIVYFDNEPVEYKENYYFMFNKPSGYITATYSEDYPTVMDFFYDFPLIEKLFPVGRLDIDTEGLLILTTDGQFGHRLAHPKWEIEKEYFAIVQGNILEKENQLEKFKKEGIFLKKENYQTKPFKIEILSSNDEKSEIFITVTEGKYHIVKRIMEEIGNPVLYLKRVRIGNLKLDESLEAGEFRELTESEISNLKKLIKL
jgi:16S rRNA pseudouridine516 synthase